MAEHKNLAAALLAFKAEVPTLPKDKVNPHYKSRYTPLDTIGEIIDPLLTKHGLVWTTAPGHDNGRPTLDYQLIHASSGEALSGTMLLLLDRENSQGLGSAQTYARRYTKVAVLDLVADEDDDGNAASRRITSTPAAKSNGHTTTAAPVEQTTRPASAKQRSLIFARADERKLTNELLANAVLRATDNEPREWDSPEAAGDWLKRSLDRLPASRVDAVLEQIAGVPA
jgi:hypothetical protein